MRALLAALLTVACAPMPAEYPDAETCQVGLEVTYYSDQTWSATAASYCDMPAVQR